MSTGNTDAATVHDAAEEAPLFAALLTPHRSMGWPGFIAVMTAVGAVNLVGAVIFTSIGAWPVLPFLGLDVIIIFLAFRANYRHARAFEEVIVTPTEIRIRKVTWHGRAREWRFNPAWTRLQQTRDEEDGQVLGLTLDEGRRRLDIATFLPPVEREGFGKALTAALAEARRGPVRTHFD
ncbi:DUF2244 domain-containing protein [Phreatobacter cathodiphilus]|uniref:DUF2244 domain-containing protein n=1 Tax=Phreatobacter cathodiphilus TaxID=1868589 RepID=A0A2S0N7G7_9HYPH|nr:DUF2244 domain-containing protein [Phreatobacter cathodiphilus]AVO43881.1 DUF2244 domain-containing protein [Phreatobacter cathodiphilus]